MPVREDFRDGVERFSVSGAKERWLEFLSLEHATLAPPLDFSREDEEFLVARAPVRGRRIRDGRIPSGCGPPLFLQACAAASFLQASGLWLDEEDLREAVWDMAEGTPRLWLARSPASLRRSGPGPAAAPVLAGFLDRLFSRGRRIAHPSARGLFDRLLATDAAYRRAEFWLSSALRDFPELGFPAAAGARARTLGSGGGYLRTPGRRAMAEKARALLTNRAPRIFAAADSFTPGGALDLEQPFDAARAARALRERHARESRGRRAVWIAVDSERWDALSRRAFETAAGALGEDVETILVAAPPPPLMPDEWRREIFVPCGTLNASLRFYDELASLARENPSGARDLAETAVRSVDWAAFAGDPTGDAPLPAMRPPAPDGFAPSGRRRRRARGEDGPGRRIELLIGAGQTREALDEAQRWVETSPRGPAELWFGLSARLAGVAGETLPAWLEALEAEREIAGGRLEEAEKRLARAADAGAAPENERRRAKLRLAEVCALRGRMKEAGQAAAAWRGAFADAPAEEIVRALILAAKMRDREGEHEAALTLLDRADGVGAGLSTLERLEAALVRAAVYSHAGRFREEKETYDRWRPAVLEARDDLLTARLLSHEALGLSDRREFAQAVARLEEALAVTQDDAVERARVSIDLAATLYHAGREGRCRELLEEAIRLAGAAGHEDLARVARTNRLELLINAREWTAAASECEALLSQARADSDDRKLLVALRYRSRLALRRGHLREAARDNAEARRLAGKISDRLEPGELWLEEGDRLLYEGDTGAARRAYEVAAADPPDRCDSAERARGRLAELAWPAGEGPPRDALAGLEALFRSDDYAAAETLARWHVRFHRAGSLPEELPRRADRILRARGGSALADAVFGAAPGPLAPPSGRPDAETLRRLRAAVAGALAGDDPEAPLAALGLTGLAIRNGDGLDVVAFGSVGEDAARRKLEAGVAEYELALCPALPAEETVALVLLLETLLFRLTAPAPPSDFAAGWRRLNVTAGDASMDEPYRRLVRFAPQPVTVLVLGESGSGKEAVARAVHALSARAAGPFVAVNVPAIPQALLESELFGHARGAFTGADRDRKGLLEEAERGTIFFDEIGDLTLPLQAKLLRALQEREVRRVGENRPRRLDVRVVSATSRNLEREVEAGRFREDLFYRLHVAVIALPPLRERGRDAQLLARHFLSRYGREYGRGDLVFAPETLAAISSHSWPGNVRELQNVVAQAAALADSGGVVGPALLPEPLRRSKRGLSGTESYRMRVDEHRRGLIAEALERAGGNRSRAARDLGLSRQALLYLIRQLGVSSRRAPQNPRPAPVAASTNR
jgi:transcriptional regulator with AAA-type ATPase domain/tetratricopeptide (TPR) repeat protein